MGPVLVYMTCKQLEAKYKVSKVQAKRIFHHMVNAEAKFLVICEVNDL